MTPAIAAILFYWIRMKVVQQLTCLTLGRPNGPAYSTDELLNTPWKSNERCTFVSLHRVLCSNRPATEIAFPSVCLLVCDARVLLSTPSGPFYLWNG